MLTEPAFNALLKTLEEPPPHAIFVLATTEAHKVPLTILSRCQRFDFRRLPLAAVVTKLQQICDHEGIRIETPALALIAKGASGSLRDAENLLEQLALYHDSDVALEQVQAELGLSADVRVRQLAEHILGKDVAAGLMTINSVSADGLDLRQFHRSLVEYLRGLLLVKAGAEESAELTPEVIAEMKQLGADISLEDISRATRLFAQLDFRLDAQSTLPLELALVDYSLSVAEKSGRLVLKEKKGDIEPPAGAVRPSLPRVAPGKGAVKPPVDVPADVTPEPVSVGVSAEPSEVPGEAAEPAATRVSQPVVFPAPRTIEDIRSRWNDFVDALRGVGSGGNLDALLRGACEPVALEGDTLVLGFYWEFHKSKIEDAKYGHLVEKKLNEVFQVPYHVRCTLVDREKRAKAPSSQDQLVKAALKMGAKIIEEERRDDE